MYEAALRDLQSFLERSTRLEERYRAGGIRARTPEKLMEQQRPVEDAVERCLPLSHRALEDAGRNSLFYSLPVAFDPAESVGCYLATIDRDEHGEPWRFIDMGAQIATRAFGENDPPIVEAILRAIPYAVNRYAHSEYQTVLSLKLKAALDRIAPKGTPRHFVVNTGAEAVENAIKAVLLNRVRMAGDSTGGVIISFDGAFHGRTLGALAVTRRRKARIGFPTFDWPQVDFPFDDPKSPVASARREDRSLRQIFDLLVTGRASAGPRMKEAFAKTVERLDAFLAKPGGDLAAFIAAERAGVAPEALRQARHIAAILVEPIQGEGGIRTGSARFFRRLRLLTKVLDVPLVFDEVQTGFGATGRMWAHELFELPAPPDIVTWAKKAQNGVLFVNDELATFFQEEKKFNTTWEGDSVGMARLLSMIDRVDLEQVRRTGGRARQLLEGLAKEYPELVLNVRGAGVMLGFDIARPDWRDIVRDRAFRRGLILLPAGERVLRFYPRYDTTEATLEEAIGILRAAIDDVVAGGAAVPLGPMVRVQALDVPLANLEAVDLDPKTFAELKPAILGVEIERYGSLAQYPPDVLKAGRRPLLQYPAEALEASINNARSAGIALRDKVSGRVVGYAIGGPLEAYDEEGVRDDPRHGESNTFYLQALATLPACKNCFEVQNHLLELLRTRVGGIGYEHISALIEDHARESGPPWLRSGTVMRTLENYLRSGMKFAYVQVPVPPMPRLAPAAAGGAREPL